MQDKVICKGAYLYRVVVGRRRGRYEWSNMVIEIETVFGMNN